MHSIEITSYLVGAAAFLVLTVMLVIGWRGGRIGVLLILAAGISTLWGGFIAYAGWQETTKVLWLLIAEILRYAAWLSFVLALLGSMKIQGLVRGLRIGVHVAWIALVLYCLAMVTGLNQVIRMPFSIGVPIMGILVLALAGLVLLEQLYRNVRPEQRWALKFLVFALGIMFAYDFFLYTYTDLYQHVNQGMWAARGFINALVVPLLAVAAARNASWALQVAVSRRVVFYTSSLFAATIYIIATVIGGYVVRYYGGDWGRVAAITLVCAAGIFLLLIVFSGQARSRLRMFLHKNFFNFRHDYREEWLKLTATLSEGAEDLQVRAIRALAQVMDSPAGILFIRDAADEFVPAASWNMTMPADIRFDSAQPFFAFMRDHQWIYDFSGPAPVDDKGLTAPPELARLQRAWLIVPLLLDAQLTGFVILAQARAPRRLDWEDMDLLRAAGSQVASILAQAASARRLAEVRQFEGFNRLTTFVMHDIKNLVAQQSLLIKNAERHKHNQQFVDDMLSTVANSVQRMTALLEQLRGEPPSGQRNRIHLDALVRRVINDHSVQLPKPEYAAVADADLYVQADAGQLAAVLGHIIRNAQDAARESGHVRVRLQSEANQAVIEVEDDGEGMDEEFVRTRLFEPFFTTKSSKGMGIGAYQAREYIHSLGGKVSVKSAIGRGTVFRLQLPRDNSQDESVQAHGMREAS